MLLRPKKPKLYVYADESCTKQRFLGLGITLHDESDRVVIAQKLTPHLAAFKSEVKWEKINDRSEPKFRALVDSFFDLNRTQNLAFHCMFVDTHRYKHRKFKASEEDTFYKMYYALFHNRVSRMGKHYDIYVYMDERTTSYSLTKLKDILNAGAIRHHALEHPPYRTIEPWDSKKSKMLQTQDVILGGITTRRNGQQCQRQSKRNMSDHIFDHCRVPQLDINRTRPEFSIWNFELE